MKNLTVAIIIAVVVVSSFNALAENWLELHLTLSDEQFSPLATIVAFSIVAVVFVFVGFIVALSLAGIIFGLLAAGIALATVGVIALWPILVIGCVLYLCLRNRPSVKQDTIYG